MSFWQYFVAVTKQFQDFTKDMTEDDRYSLIVDPTGILELIAFNSIKNSKIL